QDIEMPARFGRYRVRERLGSGILGVVYKAWDEDLRRNVAVKVPHARWLLTPRHVEIYLAQSRQIAALDSPGFVPLYDAGQADEGHCYLVMKLVDEGSLADRVGRERISAARAVRLVADAARALHQAHRQGLIHRNIKPANIL